VLVEGGAPDLEGAGDLRHGELALVAHRGRGAEQLGRNDAWAPALAPAGLGCVAPGG
jgi:hypothetical protein